MVERNRVTFFGGAEMLSNADVTFYSTKDYTRYTAHKAYFADNRGQTVKKNGIEISDVVSSYLYTDEYVPSVGDMVVRGIVDFEFNNTSQKTISESMKEFREMFSEFAVVKSVSDYKFGGLPHIEITAR